MNTLVNGMNDIINVSKNRTLIIRQIARRRKFIIELKCVDCVERNINIVHCKFTYKNFTKRYL